MDHGAGELTTKILVETTLVIHVGVVLLLQCNTLCPLYSACHEAMRTTLRSVATSYACVSE